jgi:hypothetical protein
MHTGCEAYVVHDADVPGQNGALWVKGPRSVGRPGWATAIDAKAVSTHNVILPYPVVPKKGKDLRDWINKQPRTMADFFDLEADLIEPPVEAELIQLDGRGNVTLDEYRKCFKIALAAIGEVSVEFGPAGAGKTTEALKLLAAGHFGTRVIIFCSTHSQGEDLLARCIALGIVAAKLPMVTENNCVTPDDYNRAMSIGQDPSRAVCEYCELNAIGCKYKAESAEAGKVNVLIATKLKELFAGKLIEDFKPETIIYDECTVRCLCTLRSGHMLCTALIDFVQIRQFCHFRSYSTKSVALTFGEIGNVSEFAKVSSSSHPP